MDILERAMSPSDSRDEVMQMCLESSTGEYMPVHIQASLTTQSQVPSAKVPVQASAAASSSGSRVRPGRGHVPGRAGGGWESSDSSAGEETVEQLNKIAELSMTSSTKLENE